MKKNVFSHYQFRYADGKDKMMMFIGFLAAIAVGLTTPVNNIVFGDLADVIFPLIISITQKVKSLIFSRL